MSKEQFKELLITIKVGFALLFASGIMLLQVYSKITFGILIYIVLSIVVIFLITAIIKFISKE